MSLNTKTSNQKAADELAAARMALRATHSPFATVPPPPPESTPPPAPANLSARKLELEALRQQGLATIFNKHFTSVCAETERERAKADAALAEIEARKAALRVSGKSHEDGVGGVSLSALDQMYMDLFRQREAVKKKERDAMLLYQSYITKFHHHPATATAASSPAPNSNTPGMVPTMASRIQSEVNEHLAQAHANDTQYVIPNMPAAQSSAPLLPVYHAQPSTTASSDSHMMLHTPPPGNHRQRMSPIPGSPESDQEETNPAYVYEEGQDPYSTPSTQGTEDAFPTQMNHIRTAQGPSSSTFMGPSSFAKKKNQQMTTVSPQDVRQMLDIPEDEEPDDALPNHEWQEEHPAFFGDEVQYFTNMHHEEDFDDNCSMVSGLTMQTTMSDAEQRLADFLKNETVAIRKLIDEECSVAPTIFTTSKEHETSSQESESAREASKAAALQAEEMAIMMQDAVAWATQAVTSPNSSNDHDDDDDNASFVSTAQTVATVVGKPVLKSNGQEWVAYWSDAHDREYYHDVISGAVSWILPTKDDDACLASSHIPESSLTTPQQPLFESKDHDADADEEESVEVMDFSKKGALSSASSYTSHSSSTTTRVSRQSSSQMSRHNDHSPRSVTSGQPLLSHEDVMPEQHGRKSSSRVTEYRQRLKRQQRRRRRRAAVAVVTLLVAVLGVAYFYYYDSLSDNTLTISLDHVSVTSILASASAFQSTVVAWLEESKQRIQEVLTVNVVDNKDPSPTHILEPEALSQSKENSGIKQQQQQPAATILLETTTTAPIQKNVQPNNKDDDAVVVAEMDPIPESERHDATNHDNKETRQIVPNSDGATSAVVLASSQMNTVENISTAAALSTSLSLPDNAKNASALKIVSSPPEQELPNVKGKKACFIPFAYLVARKCRQPPPVFDLKGLTDCMMQ